MCTAVVGCSNRLPRADFHLIPVDTTDGSKRFRYEYRAPDRRVPVPLDPAGVTRAPVQSATFTQLERELEDAIEHSGYCRDGYFVYDRTFDGVTYALLGECNDAADRGG